MAVLGGRGRVAVAAGLSLAALLVLALLALLPDLGGCRDEGDREYALLRKTVLPYLGSQGSQPKIQRI